MTAAARDVFFVDLSGTTDNRRVLRGFSKLLISASTLSRRILRRPGPRVLVFAPAADGKSVDWPHGAELTFTDELLDPATVGRINQWVLDLSTRMIQDPQLWPSWNGVSLGRLNLYEMQLFLMKYAQATEGLRILMDREPGCRCVVMSGYPEMARAIRADVEERTARV